MSILFDFKTLNKIEIKIEVIFKIYLEMYHPKTHITLLFIKTVK